MQLNARQVIGLIAFCSMESNGTVLPAGIISRHLKSSRSRRFFKDRIKDDGMYFTLINDAISLAKKRQTSVYGSSVIPRHTGHNRSYSPSGRIPVAGCQSFLNGFDPQTCSENDKNVMRTHCFTIEKLLVHLCRETNRKILFPDESSADDESNKATPYDFLAEFLKTVQEIAGKGCSDIFSLNFVQLAGYLGFIPIKMLGVSTINNKTAGGYKFIKMLYPNINSTETAQEYFKNSTKIIQKLFGSSMTFAFAENLLCELYRDRNGSNHKKDVTFFFPHRRNNWKGLQNFFRLKMGTCNKMELEFLAVPSDNDRMVPPGCVKLMTWKDGLTAGSGMMRWDHHGPTKKKKYKQELINYNSKLRVHEDIRQFYLLRTKEKVSRE